MKVKCTGSLIRLQQVSVAKAMDAAVIRMLEKIGSPENVPAYLEKVKKREAVLSGFGHRVYKTVRCNTSKTELIF